MGGYRKPLDRGRKDNTIPLEASRSKILVTSKDESRILLSRVKTKLMTGKCSIFVGFKKVTPLIRNFTSDINPHFLFTILQIKFYLGLIPW